MPLPDACALQNRCWTYSLLDAADAYQHGEFGDVLSCRGGQGRARSDLLAVPDGGAAECDAEPKAMQIGAPSHET